MKRLLQFIVLGIFLLTAFTVLAEENSLKDFDYSRPDFQSAVGMLAMEGHGTHDVSNCSVKKLYYEEVAGMMQKGMTKDEIIDYYVQNLGEEALMAPPKKGFNLTLWITPFLLLLLAGGGILLALKKWKKPHSSSKVNLQTSEDRTEEEIMSSMIDAERKKYY